MSNYLVIYDYKGDMTNTKLNLDKLDDIFMITIKTISGDEVAEVIYKNGEIKRFDSSHDRWQDFYDGEEIIYSPSVNLIEEYKKRSKDAR